MRRELRNDLEPHDADALVPLGERLLAQRTVPRAAFRGDLRRRLAGGSRRAERPRLLWARVASSLASGLLLLAIAAAGVAGSGPFAV
jgi:hypothetical protein